MIRNVVSWLRKARRAALAVAALLFVVFCGSAVHAQNFIRSPNININSRFPTINPAVAPRINPNVAGGGGIAVTTIDRTPLITAVPRLGVTSTSGCDDGYRGSEGECFDRPVVYGNGKKGVSSKNKNSGPGGNTLRTAIDPRAVANELVAEINGALTDAQAYELGRRYGLTWIASQNFPLLGSSIGLFRITDRRAVDVVRREFATDRSVRSVQLNFRYVLQDQNTVRTEGDPAQYALAQLRLPQAHTLARGMNVTIAMIDSGVDVGHPELANSIADSFDALGSKEGPHVHGTGVAGAIAAHARLMGSAPEARILAIRAFGVTAKGAQSTSYVVLKALDYAALHGAQIVNMSFAGPNDPLIARAIAATATRGILMVAAAGNAGAKSPPLYPAANPAVMAVSGTDAQDKLFAASNRGSHVAIAAPGADIFLPAPDGKYQMTSGTSFSAAYISGVAALVMERNSSLKPDEVRAILVKTARDLGPPGRDDLFGAGEADAFAAVTAAAEASAKPVAAVSERTVVKTADPDNASSSRSVDESVPSVASDKSAGDEALHPMAR